MAQFNSDTLLRQWHMLRMIPRQPLKITAKDLHGKLQAEEFQVTKRTIERDLQALSELFPLVSDERDKPFGWSWSKDAPIFNLPSLSNNESLTLAMVEQHLSSLLPASTLGQLKPYFSAARHHLSGIPSSVRSRSWLNKVRTVPPMQPLIPPAIKPVVQQVIGDALLHDKQLDIKYLKRGEDSSVDYRIHPLAIVQRGPMTYLYCRLFDYEDLRTLAMHRIQAAAILDDDTVVPGGFSIDEEIAKGKFGFGDGKKIQLEAIFRNGAGEHLYETPLSLDQVLTDMGDESVRIKASVIDTPQLHWWILGFGNGVEVIKPVALRKAIQSNLADALNRYQK